MLNKMGYVSLTVNNLEESIIFYEDILGMKLIKQKIMECKSTEVLFGISSCNVHVAHLRTCDDCGSPDIELLEFREKDTLKDDIRINRVSISGISFKVENIQITYEDLKAKGVEFISEPQYFESVEEGFGKIKSVYFRDPNGIILELHEIIEEGRTAEDLDIDTCVGPSEYSATHV